MGLQQEVLTFSGATELAATTGVDPEAAVRGGAARHRQRIDQTGSAASGD